MIADVIFVVLHYLAEKMTEECVDSLLRHTKSTVVIVDNGSYNGSGYRIAERYSSCDNVHVVFSEENVGFAKGNNLGYEKALEINPKSFIVVMNNDVIIDQEKFCEMVNEIYRTHPFAVLGPDILSPRTGEHQNPISIHPFTEETLRLRIQKYKSMLRFFYVKYFIYTLKIKLGLRKPSRPELRMEAGEADYNNPVLHGACYIFSPVFTANREYAFNPSTFLYGEEDILHYECMKSGLTMIYDPTVKVRHMEDVSTDMRYRSEFRRVKMKYQNILDSNIILSKLMRK